jgi:predicted nucleic acid-binding Zn ribbon protein
MPTQVEDPELELCWKAWEEKNTLHDRRIKRRIRFMLCGVGALLAVIMLVFLNGLL